MLSTQTSIHGEIDSLNRLDHVEDYQVPQALLPNMVVAPHAPIHSCQQHHDILP
uniref:Uncharacterized protein n=1 Tax=Lotus japonicus TaxID=34305 RepID=I3SD09_LOTJA|nr:unknown [Lotus japonicus]